MQFGDLSETILSVSNKLYADQRVTVLTGVESDEFGIARGTQQGSVEQPYFQLGSAISNGEKTLRLGMKRAWASNWVTRTYPTFYLLATCL